MRHPIMSLSLLETLGNGMHAPCHFGPKTHPRTPLVLKNHPNHVPAPFGNPRETVRHTSRASARDGCRALPLWPQNTSKNSSGTLKAIQSCPRPVWKPSRNYALSRAIARPAAFGPRVQPAISSNIVCARAPPPDQYIVRYRPRRAPWNIVAFVPNIVSYRAGVRAKYRAISFANVRAKYRAMSLSFGARA